MPRNPHILLATATAALAAALLLTTACGPAYVQPVAIQQNGWNGDPCAQSYFDAIACQTAINVGGWYVNGMLYRHSYGSYGYGYYAHQNFVFVQHGGHVTPYSAAVRNVRPQPQQVQSVGAGSNKPYTPGQRPSTTPAAPAYKPAQRPSAPYMPASRPSSSYSPSRRK